MNALTFVTAAFLGARKDRPDSYYLEPLKQMVCRVSKSPFKLAVWTWEQSLHAIRQIVPADCVYIGDPMQLCLRTSPDYRWRLLGKHLHACPHDMMCQYTDMLAVYMSRPGMIEQMFSLTDTEGCLWFDCGWVNSVLGRCDNSVFDSWRLGDAFEKLAGLLNQDGLIMCRTSGIKEALSRHVSTYRVKTPYFTPGGVWACRRSSVTSFVESVATGWRRLLAAGCLQDDECAMTLAMWENDTPTLEGSEWYRLLCGETVEPKTGLWL